MKSIGSIAILLLIAFQVSMKPLLMLEWKINQDLITAKYCENKDRPMLHCDGKCYLAKQLRKLEMQEKEERSKHPFPAEKLKLAETQFICPQFDLPAFVASAFKQKTATVGERSNLYQFNFHSSIAHPPEQDVL